MDIIITTFQITVPTTINFRKMVLTTAMSITNYCQLVKWWGLFIWRFSLTFIKMIILVWMDRSHQHVCPRIVFFKKKAVTILNYDLINIAGENKYHSFQKSTTMNAWPRFKNKNVWLSLWIIYCNKYLIPIGLIVLIIKHLKLGQTPNVEDSRVWRSINSVIEFSKSIGYQSQRLQ